MAGSPGCVMLEFIHYPNMPSGCGWYNNVLTYLCTTT